MPTYPKILASVEDPTKLSLMISSATQAILWALGLWFVHAHFDPTTAANAMTTAQSQAPVLGDQVQTFVNVGLTVFAGAMTMYHSGAAIFGGLRKLIGLTKKPVVTNTVTAQQ